MDEEQYSRAKTSVWWDIENCPVPRGADPHAIAQNISSALSDVSYRGPVNISAYGDTNRIPSAVQNALNSTGVALNHVPSGVKDASDKKILVDMLFWAVDNPAPANYLLISGDRDFSNALHQLRMRRYNILLAQPPNVAHPPNVAAPLVAAAKVVWLWTSLLAGGPPLPNVSALPNRPSDLDDQINRQNMGIPKPILSETPREGNQKMYGDNKAPDKSKGKQYKIISTQPSVTKGTNSDIPLSLSGTEDPANLQKQVMQQQKKQSNPTESTDLSDQFSSQQRPSGGNSFDPTSSSSFVDGHIAQTGVEDPNANLHKQVMQQWKLPRKFTVQSDPIGSTNSPGSIANYMSNVATSSSAMPTQVNNPVDISVPESGTEDPNSNLHKQVMQQWNFPNNFTLQSVDSTNSAGSLSSKQGPIAKSGSNGSTSSSARPIQVNYPVDNGVGKPGTEDPTTNLHKQVIQQHELPRQITAQSDFKESTVSSGFLSSQKRLIVENWSNSASTSSTLPTAQVNYPQDAQQPFGYTQPLSGSFPPRFPHPDPHWSNRSTPQHFQSQNLQPFGPNNAVPLPYSFSTGSLTLFPPNSPQNCQPVRPNIGIIPFPPNSSQNSQPARPNNAISLSHSFSTGNLLPNSSPSSSHHHHSRSQSPSSSRGPVTEIPDIGRLNIPEVGNHNGPATQQNVDSTMNPNPKASRRAKSFRKNNKSQSTDTQTFQGNVLHQPYNQELQAPDTIQPQLSETILHHIGVLLRVLQTLKNDKMIPSEANIADCIHYGDASIPIFNLHLALNSAIEKQILVVHSTGGPFQMFLPQNEKLWKCINPLDLNVKQSKQIWDELSKFLSSAGGGSAILSSQCRYHAAIILKKSCLTNLVLGEILQLLNAAIALKRWIIPHRTMSGLGWQPLRINVADCDTTSGSKTNA